MLERTHTCDLGLSGAGQYQANDHACCNREIRGIRTATRLNEGPSPNSSRDVLADLEVPEKPQQPQCECYEEDEDQEGVSEAIEPRRKVR